MTYGNNGGKHMENIIRQSKGFTLLEVILGIAIIGIISIGIIPILSNSFLLTTRSGQRSDRIYDARESTENMFYDNSGDHSVKIPKKLNFKFRNTEFSVEGQEIKTEVPMNPSGTITIKSFQPN